MRPTDPAGCANARERRVIAAPARSLLAGLAALAALATMFAPARTPLAAQVADRQIHSLVLVDQLEQRAARNADPVAWDVIGWVGGDFSRVWFKSSGALATRGGGKESEVQLLFGRLVAPFWDFQVGVQVNRRADRLARHTQLNAVVAFEGLAPYWFELEPSVYISDRGDVSAELTASYDLHVTQRLVAQPRADIRAALQEVPEFGIGSGLSDAAVGLRLRYEWRREVAPYVGVRWNRSVAGTATLARAAGEPTSGVAAVAGLRLWF